MKALKSTGIWFACSIILLGMSARPAAAQNFAGFYQVTNATDMGDGTTQVTVSIDIVSYLPADAVNAAVSLGDSVDPLASYGPFGSQTISSGCDVVLTAEFIVPSTEYARWGSGGVTPNILVGYTDADGLPQTDSVALTQAPVQTD